jgi:hypothetical protein
MIKLLQLWDEGEQISAWGFAAQQFRTAFSGNAREASELSSYFNRCLLKRDFHHYRSAFSNRARFLDIGMS